MLSEYRELFKQKAAAIPNYQKISKTELCNLYIENEFTDKNLAEAYLSALVLRYWNNIAKYYAQSSSIATVEDCYEWLIEAIRYALEKRQWLDPESPMFNDKNGPDKIINRCIKSVRLTFYQASNRYKRQLNANQVSLEKLSEDYGDADPVKQIHTFDTYSTSDLTDIIKTKFIKSDPFLAFMLDSIIQSSCFIHKQGKLVFSKKKLTEFMNSIDDSYCTRFSKRYSLDIDSVKIAALNCTNLSTSSIARKIDFYLSSLKADKLLLNYLQR